MKCFIDGDSLCIVADDFIDLQESKAFFIKLDEAQIAWIKDIEVK